MSAPEPTCVTRGECCDLGCSRGHPHCCVHGALRRGVAAPLSPEPRIATEAMRWQRIVDEFCEFNPYADRVIMGNFAGWLAARGAQVERIPEPTEAALETAQAVAREMWPTSASGYEIIEASVRAAYRAQFSAAPPEERATGDTP